MIKLCANSTVQGQCETTRSINLSNDLEKHLEFVERSSAK